MADYEPKIIEPKWQNFWQENKSWRAVDEEPGKKNKYILVEFPYPSGDGLHVGHVKNYTATDAFARFNRMRGFNVLHPMGWDAFGLPTENSAIKNKIQPAKLTKQNTDRFREQMRMLGLSYDWDREINTTDPAYYKWTQWIFLQLFKRGLAYEQTVPINWCPSCKTGLANEEVIDGKCERCGTAVAQRPMRQWMLKITAYAEQLLAGLDELDWPKHIKEIQRNWIGRREGINIIYDVKDSEDKITCFTTRPDTNFGATFVVLAPEHEFSRKIAGTNKEVAKYIEQATLKTERDRLAEGTSKTGAFTGHFAVNQLNGRLLPIWVSDFVLGHFGTGAVVGVPGHDLRDFEFASKFDLQIERVVVASNGDMSPITEREQVQEAAGTMINSDFLNGMAIADAIEKMKDHLEEKGWGKRVVTYNLRDWVFSRQRYWGEPMPLIFCESCKKRIEETKKRKTKNKDTPTTGEMLNPGWVPVPEAELPLELPQINSYEPTGTGESPLARVEDWVNTTCPQCGGPAKRETNTMPQWAGSSWYWIRFTDPHNDQALADPKKIAAWLPVDVYVGGAEHAVLHLLYGRFWNIVLHDVGAVNTSEPFTKRYIVGVVLGADGQKMSKSRGNVVNPDDEVAKYGADTVRVFALFMGPFEGSAVWSTEGIKGSHRFVKKIWNFFQKMRNEQAEVNETITVGDSDAIALKLHQTIKRVTASMEQFKFNTAVSSLMELLNMLEEHEYVAKSARETFVLLLSPLAPHLSQELWEQLGHSDLVQMVDWPTYDEKILGSAQITMPVQVNGKVRGTITVAPGSNQEEVEKVAREVPNVAKYLDGADVKKVILVADKMVSFVIRNS